MGLSFLLCAVLCAGPGGSSSCWAAAHSPRGKPRLAALATCSKPMTLGTGGRCFPMLPVWVKDEWRRRAARGWPFLSDLPLASGGVWRVELYQGFLTSLVGTHSSLRRVVLSLCGMRGILYSSPSLVRFKLAFSNCSPVFHWASTNPTQPRRFCPIYFFKFVYEQIILLTLLYLSAYLVPLQRFRLASLFSSG